MEFGGCFPSSALSKLQRKPRSRSEDHIRAVELPDDLIITKILPRLPAQVLIRFKCVSKKWHNLITNDPHFIHTHLRHQSQASPPSIVLLKQYTRKNQKKFHVLTLSHSHPNPEALKSDLPFTSHIYTSTIVGSCNGLICLYLSTTEGPTFALWNPATRELRNLGAPKESPDTPIMKQTLHGFCFDEEKNDYKVVKLTREFCTVKRLYLLHVHVYATSLGSWTRLEPTGFSPADASSLAPSPAAAVPLGGALHWLASREASPTRRGFRRRHCVVSYGPRDAALSFADVPAGPGDPLSPFEQRLQLAKLRGSLCLLSFLRHRCDDRSYRADVWFVNLPGFGGVGGGLAVWAREPLRLESESYWVVSGFWRERLVMQVKWKRDGGSELVSYDPFVGEDSGGGVSRVDECSFGKIMNVDRFSYLREAHHEYVPSLVSAYNPGEKREVVTVQVRDKRKTGRFRKILGVSKRWVLGLIH